MVNKWKLNTFKEKKKVGDGIRKWQMQSKKNSNIYYHFFCFALFQAKKIKKCMAFFYLCYRTLRWSWVYFHYYLYNSSYISYGSLFCHKV
jgi:hypothetical protein